VSNDDFCSEAGASGGKVQASLAAFLSRGKPATAPPLAAAASAATLVNIQKPAQPVLAVQERSIPQQEVSQEQRQQQQHTQEQVADVPHQAQEEQLEGQGSDTYASQLSAAIAASLADARPAAEPQTAPRPANRQVSRAIDNRLPVRTDSYLDLQNNRQYRSWAAFISQAGQGSGGSGAAGQQSAAATAWQVLNPLLRPVVALTCCQHHDSCSTCCSGCMQIVASVQNDTEPQGFGDYEVASLD